MEWWSGGVVEWWSRGVPAYRDIDAVTPLDLGSWNFRSYRWRSIR